MNIWQISPVYDDSVSALITIDTNDLDALDKLLNAVPPFGSEYVPLKTEYFRKADSEFFRLEPGATAVLVCKPADYEKTRAIFASDVEVLTVT